MFKYYIYKFAHFCVSRLPLIVSYRIATFISGLHYIFSFRDRRAVRENLRVIMQTDKDLNRYTREVFDNFGKYLVDFFTLPRKLTLNYISEKIKVVNSEYIKKALDKGKGGIILTAHIGNWELGAMVLGSLGYPLMAIALPHKERPVNDLFNHQRELTGVTVIPSNMAVRRCMETLKNNHLVALVADRDFSMTGEILDFLGRKALIPKGAAVFSYRTGAPIIPCFLTRNSDDTFTMQLEEPIDPPFIIDDTVDQKALIHIMKKYAAVIENKIRQFPTQWLMFRQFWVK